MRNDNTIDISIGKEENIKVFCSNIYVFHRFSMEKHRQRENHRIKSIFSALWFSRCLCFSNFAYKMMKRSNVIDFWLFGEVKCKRPMTGTHVVSLLFKLFIKPKENKRCSLWLTHVFCAVQEMHVHVGLFSPFFVTLMQTYTVFIQAMQCSVCTGYATYFLRIFYTCSTSIHTYRDIYK